MEPNPERITWLTFIGWLVLALIIAMFAAPIALWVGAASQPIVIRRDGRRQDLDGDLTLELGVGSPIDLPHSALTEQGGDVIDAKTGAGSESQTAGSIAVSVARTRLILCDAARFS